MTTATAIYTLVKASTLKTRLTTLSTESANNTLSLAYYTMINGNVSPLASCDMSISNLLDRTYRQYVCASFDKTKGVWVYDKTKALKLIADLKLEYNISTFESFVAAVLANQETKKAAAAAKEEAEKALDPEQKLQADKDRVLAYLIKSGLTELQLRDLVLQVEKERSKADLKSIKANTAGAKAAADAGVC